VIISIPYRATLERIARAGSVGVDPDNGWGFVKVPSWNQGEWVSPAIIQKLVNEGWLVQQGKRLVPTDETKRSVK